MTRVSGELEETIAQLDALHAPVRARHAADLATLAGMVGRLDESWGAEEEPVAFEPRRRRPDDERRRPDDEDADPFGGVSLNERPGHLFTGRLREKLIAEATKKSDW